MAVKPSAAVGTTRKGEKFGNKKLPGLCHGSICLHLNKFDIGLYFLLNKNNKLKS